MRAQQTPPNPATTRSSAKTRSKLNQTDMQPDSNSNATSKLQLPNKLSICSDSCHPIARITKDTSYRLQRNSIHLPLWNTQRRWEKLAPRSHKLQHTPNTPDTQLTNHSPNLYVMIHQDTTPDLTSLTKI